jgi:putative peptide zinc metalloprotease protein
MLAVLLGLGAPSLALAQSPTPTPAETAQVVAGGSDPDNVVVQQNTKDGSSIFKLGFKVIRVLGESVDSGNAAVAVASCEACRTVAIAISIVLIESDPSIVEPENLALAMNVDCVLCETLALAYQLVLSTDGMTRIGHDGTKAIQELLDQIEAVGSSDLPLDEIDAQVSALVTELFQVVRDSLIPLGPEPTEPSPTPTPTESPTDAVSPAPSETPSPDPTTPAPSPSPTETPTPEPSPTA